MRHTLGAACLGVLGLASFAALAASLPGCGGSRGVIYGVPFPADARYASPRVAHSAAGDDPSARDPSNARITEALATSDLVFVGRVVHVGVSPGVWCGIAVTTQGVLYRVEKVLRGRAPADEVVVHHLLVGPPATEATEPRLSEAIWHEGAQMVVAASFGPAPGADLIPGGYGLLRLTETMSPIAGDGSLGRPPR